MRFLWGAQDTKQCQWIQFMFECLEWWLVVRHFRLLLQFLAETLFERTIQVERRFLESSTKMNYRKTSLSSLDSMSAKFSSRRATVHYTPGPHYLNRGLYTKRLRGLLHYWILIYPYSLHFFQKWSKLRYPFIIWSHSNDNINNTWYTLFAVFIFANNLAKKNYKMLVFLKIRDLCSK